MDSKKKFLGGHVLSLVVLCIAFLGIFSTCSLASGTWILDFEKDVFNCSRYWNATFTNKTGTNYKQTQFVQGVWSGDNVNLMFQTMSTMLYYSEYSQIDYPYVLVTYNDTNKNLMFTFAKHATLSVVSNRSRATLLYTNPGDLIRITFTLDNNYSITNVSSITTINTEILGRIQPGYNATNDNTFIQSGIYLSKTIQSNTLQGLSLRQDYTPFQLVGYSSINSIDRTDILDLSSQTENYVLSNGINVGSAYSTYQLNAYYYDTNNNKVSINDYIVSGVYPTTDFYWGKNYRFIIPFQYLQNIPENTVFYYELIGNHTQYNGTAQDLTQPAFNLNAGEMYFFETTSSSPSPTPTPTGTPTPSGDSSGDTPPSYPTPIDYSNQLEHISGELALINDNMPTSGDISNIVNGGVTSIIGSLTSPADVDDTTITSGDIENAMGLTFSGDPYENFWYSLTMGLNDALTTSVRELHVVLPFGVWDIYLDNIGFPAPNGIKFIIGAFSNLYLCWVMMKWIKVMIDKISSGGVDDVLALNEEEGIIDLF